MELVLDGDQYVHAANEAGIARSRLLPELTIEVAELFAAATEW